MKNNSAAILPFAPFLRFGKYPFYFLSLEVIFILSRRSFYLQQINLFSGTTGFKCVKKMYFNFEEYPKYYIFTFFNLIIGKSDLLLNVTDILSIWENTFEIYFGVDSSMQVMYNIMLPKLNTLDIKKIERRTRVLRKFTSPTGDLVTLTNLQMAG